MEQYDNGRFFYQNRLIQNHPVQHLVLQRDGYLAKTKAICRKTEALAQACYPLHVKIEYFETLANQKVLLLHGNCKRNDYPPLQLRDKEVC